MDASSALDTLTSKALRVVIQGTKKDPKGRILGKRVELVFRAASTPNAKAVIAWTDGAELVRLSSSSLPPLLDFEDQYYPGKPAQE